MESYVLGRLPPSEQASLEEHLLICSACRDRVSDIEAFAHGTKEALTTPAPAQPASRISGWLRRPAVSMALAFVALIAVISFFSTSRTKVGDVSALTLTAQRGAMPSTVPAKELDLTLAGASAGNQVFRAQIISPAGQSMWSGLGQSTPAGVLIKAEQRLPPGDYFVRLYATSGEMLGQYGFRIRQ